MARTSTRQEPKNHGSGSPARESNRAALPPRDDEIPVLIRLPDLSEPAVEPPGSADGSRRGSPGESPRTPPAALDLRASGIPVTREADAAELASVSSATPHADSALNRALDSKPARVAIAYAAAGFRRLRLAGQITVAILLVGLFVAAYFAIVGTRGETKKDAPPEVSTAQQTDVAAPEPPPPPKKPVAAPAGKSLLPPKLTTGSTPAKPAPSRKEGAAAAPPSSSPPAAAAKTEPPPPEPENQNEAKPVSTGAAKVQTDPPAEPRPNSSKRWQGLDTFEKPPAAPPPAGNAQPLELSPPAAAPPRNSTAQAAGARYPTTDPTRFRYPERYHEVLDAASGERASDAFSRRGGTADSGANTAQRPARMDPPPWR